LATTDNQRAALCAARFSDTASQLVEINEMVADWLANFRVMIKLQENYKVVKSASKIRNLLMFDKDKINLRRFYDNFTMFCKLGPWLLKHTAHCSSSGQ